jgi:aldehyde dehydrogenase (NAD+)
MPDDPISSIDDGKYHVTGTSTPPERSVEILFPELGDAAGRALTGGWRSAAGFLLAGMRRRRPCHHDRMPLRCLLVDDSNAFIEAASVLLQREGVVVAGVASGTADALRQARALRPDVILVDIGLGDESGLDLARLLAWDGQGGGAAVILISARAEADYGGLIAESPAAGFLAKSEERPHLLGGTTTVRREPVGVVGAIAPWNYPQTLAAFKHAPAMAAGCTVVLKPSPETVLDAMLFAEAVAASDIPPGVINIVPGGRATGAYLVQHRDVDKVAFTGSTAAGRQIAETCGRLLRPVTLELGGKSAAIVLDDADLDLAKIGEDLFAATLLNNGQTCYLGTRVLAPSSRYDEVVGTLAAFASSLTVGDALDPDTQIGPMASTTHRDRVEGYIAKGLGDGARLVTGGGRPGGLDAGWFVQPTVFAEVDNNSTIAQEEIFGPVLSVIRYTDTDDAIRIANDSDYGLGGTVWTSDPERGKAVARRVRTGTIGINRYMVDPGAPFGGVKASGIGRELGPDSVTAYQQFKSIYS